MPDAVYILWVIVLVIAVLVLPVVVYLLHRTLRAARSIARYFEEMRIAGEGIAVHTGHLPALEQTIEVGGNLLATAKDIDAHAAALEGVIKQRAARSI